MKKLLFILLTTSSFLCAEEKLFILRGGNYETVEIPESINKLLTLGWEVKSVTPSAIGSNYPRWVVVLKKEGK